MIPFSNIGQDFFLKRTLKNKWIKIGPRQCVLEGAQNWGSWDEFLFSANFVPIFRVIKDVYK